MAGKTETVAAEQLPPGAPAGRSALLPTPIQFFVLLVLYFGSQLAARTLISEAAGIDETDQLVIVQGWQWGYGPQAPLYPWFMLVFLKLFGSSTFALTLLRETLLLGIYALTYANARVITRSHACGVAAAVALQFHPTIVWESQRELTHSLAASLMVLGTLLTFLRLRPGQWMGYLGFGACAGLALLSKYNTSLFVLALLLAGLLSPEFRPRILNWRMGLALAICAAIVLPNLGWVAAHRQRAFSLTYKFGIHETMSWAKSVRLGVWDWVSSVAVHVAPLLVVFGALFWKPAFVERTARLHDETDRLLAKIFVLIFAMALLSVFVLKVTQFKDRWLQPLFVPLTILLVGVARDSLAPKAARLKWLLALGLIATLGAGTLSSGRLLFTERRGRRDVLNAPFTKLAAALAGPGERADCILAEGYWLAGNLRLRFPGKHIYNYQCYPPDAGVGHRCLVVWDASQRPQPPAVLANFAREFTGREAQTEPIYVEELWKYHRSKSMRLGYWELSR